MVALKGVPCVSACLAEGGSDDALGDPEDAAPLLD